LQQLETLYLEQSLENQEVMFYSIRDKFNEEKKKIDYKNTSYDWVEHAADLIFLNKTCFNGLYRLNKKGLYNVPFGKHKKPTICDSENLKNVSIALKGVTLLQGDFEQLTNYIDDTTFVYMDPPYRPLSTTASFNDYSDSPFNDDSQRRLAAWYKLLNNKQALLMLSNSDPTNTDPEDAFFEDLYKPFNINKVSASRAINSKGSGRGSISELLITNEQQTAREASIMEIKTSDFVYKKDENTFSYLLDTLKDSIKGWDYFVNWNKAQANVRDIEIQLNILNYLIGKESIEKEFKYLLRKHPEIIKAIPILIACREEQFKILSSSTSNMFDTQLFDFSGKVALSDTEIEKTITFLDKTGILDLIRNKTIKNVVDYVFGIEVGLDSNGRKNRSGTAMEDLVELFIKKICEEHNYHYLIQASPKTIKDNWGYNVTVDKTARNFDFAINTGKRLCLIETNYYGGGGSKLKATAGEYKTLHDVLSKDGHEFIWVTDGKGWLTANRPLNETFYHNNYILNLNMVESGVLEQILSGIL
jgi:type II restriction enzyme